MVKLLNHDLKIDGIRSYPGKGKRALRGYHGAHSEPVIPMTQTTDLPEGLTELQTERLERILSVTSRLVAELGAEKMTMRHIAAASQVAAGTLYNRFGTKDHLVAVAIADYFERSIQAVMAAHSANKTPLQKLRHGLQVLAAEILGAQMFARALMSTCFKIDNDRQMPDRLLGLVRQTWRALVDEMVQQRALKPWVDVALVVEEISDRTFGVVMRWAQRGFSDAELEPRLVFAVLTVLAAVSRGAQAKLIEQELAGLGRPVAG